MTFLWPFMLLTIGLVPLFVLAARRIEEGRQRKLAALGGVGRLGAAAGGGARGAGQVATRTGFAGGTTADRVAAVLIIAALVLFAIAMARPQATVALPRVEGTIMLTFDVSGSMAADDVQPTRLEAAKAAAKAIVDRQPPGVVIGVVAFSDAGLSVLAPTSEQASVIQAIDRLGPARGTSVGQGILAALGAIKQAESDTPADYYSNRSPEPTATPAPVAPGSHSDAAIVLFSDGENNERPDPVDAAQVAANEGVRILTIGVGTTAGTTLDLDGFKVQTALDESLLQQVSDLTKGTYAPATSADPGTVYSGLAERLVSRDEAIEITALVAGAGLILLVAGVAISLARAGRMP
jgi:Ca-activated chloride channel family protein